MNYRLGLLVLCSAATAACEPLDSAAANDAGVGDAGGTGDSISSPTPTPTSTPTSTPVQTSMPTQASAPTGTETGTETEVEAGTETGTEAEAGTGIETGSGSGTGTGTGTGLGTGTGTGTNLVTNGSFADGTTDWGITYGTATVSIVGGDLCVAVAAANDTTTIVLGWPEPTGTAGVPLSATGSYTFSYTAHATKEAVTMDAKVGDTVGPNFLPVDFVSETDAVATTATTFTHPFTPASGADPTAGIAFTFVAGVAQSLCFANVSLVEN
jgi:hypothetical protein